MVSRFFGFLRLFRLLPARKIAVKLQLQESNDRNRDQDPQQAPDGAARDQGHDDQERMDRDAAVEQLRIEHISIDRLNDRQQDQPEPDAGEIPLDQIGEQQDQVA